MAKPVAISKVIGPLMAGFKKPQETVQAALLRKWPEIISPQAAPHATPAKITGDALLVAVDHAGWRQELVMGKKEILERIRCCIPESTIRDIRFTVAGPKEDKKVR